MFSLVRSHSGTASIGRGYKGIYPYILALDIRTNSKSLMLRFGAATYL